MSDVAPPPRWAALSTLLVLLVVTVLSRAAPAQAQSRQVEDGQTLGRFELTDLDAVLRTDDPDAALRTEFEIAAGPVARRDLRLVTTVHARIETPEELDEVTSGDLPPVFSSVDERLEDLPAGTTRLVRTSVPAAELALQGEDRPGVYPVQIQLFSGTAPLAENTTTAIVVAPDGPAPLPTSIVLDLQSSAAPLLSDVPNQALGGQLEPDGEIVSAGARLRDLMAGGSAAGMTLVVDGRLLHDLAGVADGFVRADGTAVGAERRLSRRTQAALQSIRDLARRGDTEVLALPYGPADLVALVRGGGDEAALDGIEFGRERTAALLGATVEDAILVPPAGLDAATLATIGQTQPNALLMNDEFVAFAESEQLEPLRSLRTADGGEVRVLVPDEGLATLIQRPDSVPETLQQFRAETALRWFAGDPRGSAAVLLRMDGLDPRSIDVATLRQAVSDTSWLRPVALSTLADTVRPSSRLVRLAYSSRAVAQELPPDYVAQFRQARAALDPLASILPEDDTTPGSLAEILAPMPSVAYRDPAVQAEGMRRGSGVIDRLESLSEAVNVQPSAPITLTATTGEVPVTITNAGDVPLQVTVRAQASRFTIEADRQTITMAPNSAQRLEFAVRSLNPGGFAPIAVSVSDPDGTRILATEQLSVRSTAIPVVGLVATIGSVLVLLVWSIRQRPGRRSRSKDATSSAHENAA